MEDISLRTSVIVSKKSYFETTKTEEETKNVTKDGNLSKNLEYIDEISKNLIEVNRSTNEKYQKDILTDNDGKNIAPRDESIGVTLDEEMVDLNRISKVGSIHFICFDLIVRKERMRSFLESKPKFVVTQFFVPVFLIPI